MKAFIPARWHSKTRAQNPLGGELGNGLISKKPGSNTYMRNSLAERFITLWSGPAWLTLWGPSAHQVYGEMIYVQCSAVHLSCSIRIQVCHELLDAMADSCPQSSDIQDDTDSRDEQRDEQQLEDEAASDTCLPSCESCRKRKLKCSRGKPVCSNCERLGRESTN